jgi:hypothetical protein
MASSGPRFCPRCGTGRVGDMGFCPNCGLDLRELPTDERSTTEPRPDASTSAVPSTSATSPSSATPPTPASRYDASRDDPLLGRLLGPGLLVLLLLVAVAWFTGWGPFARPAGNGPLGGGGEAAIPSSPFLPPVTTQPLSIPPGLTATPVGLTILSPADGAVVGTKQVTVIGTAPPGLGITQDISLGLDRHTTADGTGHWAIQVDLSEGENQLKFRIGDDGSTTQTIRVIYLAPAVQ